MARPPPAPRRYHSPLRQEAMAQTRQRIVAATVALHAEQGAAATTHAHIAARAAVSLPTVYKHFPTRADLLPHCMGQVAAAAPPLDEAALLGAPAAERVERLVEAVYRRHAHFAPWLRWAPTDTPHLPELAAALAAGERELARLVLAMLAPLLPAGRPPAGLRALALLLLGFAGWQQLVAALGGDESAAMRTASAALHLCLRQPGDFP